MQSHTVFDRAQARDFLAALDPLPLARFGFRTADDGPAKDRRNAVRAYGTLDSGIRQSGDPAKHGRPCNPGRLLEYMQGHGAGAFVVVNETDGNGQAAANITRARAVFADCDDAASASQARDRLARAGIVPTMLVESGGTADGVPRLHPYFGVRGLALDGFTAFQRLIASKLGSDPAVSDQARIMRVAGSWHLKGTPRPVRLLEARDLEYDADELRERFAAMPEIAPAQITRRGHYGSGRALDTSGPTERLRFLLDHHGGLIAPAVRALIAEARSPSEQGGAGNRHVTLLAVAARLAQAGWQDQNIRDLVLPAASAAWEVGDDLEARLDSTIAWVRNRESLAHAAPVSGRASRLAAAFSGRASA